MYAVVNINIVYTTVIYSIHTCDNMLGYYNIILYGNAVQLVMDHCANVKGSGDND